MRNRKIWYCKINFLLLLIICSVNSTDVSASKKKIVKLLKDISHTDSLIAAKKKKIEALRSDQKQESNDSIAANKEYNKTISTLNRKAKRLDSLSNLYIDELANISTQKDETIQDSINSEKKKSESLSALKNENEHLDSLKTAAEKKGLTLSKEYESTQNGKKNAEKEKVEKLSVVVKKFSYPDSMQSVVKKEKDKLLVRQKKFELDEKVEYKKKELSTLMKMEHEVRTVKSGAFETTQKELGDLLKQQKELSKNADIAQWEKSVSKIPLKQRKLKLSSLLRENEKRFADFAAQRGKLMKDSIAIDSGFQITIQEFKSKLTMLDSLRKEASRVIDSCNKRYAQIQPDEQAVVENFNNTSLRIIKKTRHLENLAQEKKKLLDETENQRKKIRQDSLTVQKEYAVSIQKKKKLITKSDKSFSENENALAKLEKAKLKSETSVKQEIALLDSLITQNEKKTISFIIDSDRFRQSVREESNKNSENERSVLTEIAAQNLHIKELKKEHTDLIGNTTKLKKDSIAIQQKSMINLRILRKKAARYDSLIVVKQEELSQLREHLQKVHQDTVAAHDSIIAQVQSAHTASEQEKDSASSKKEEIKSAKSDRDSKKEEYRTLRKINEAADSLVQNTISEQDSSISKMKKETISLSGMLDSLLRGTAYKEAVSKNRKRKKVLQSCEKIYRLLWSGKAKDAQVQFKKKSSFLKKKLNPDSYDAIKTAIAEALKKPAHQSKPATPKLPSPPKPVSAIADDVPEKKAAAETTPSVQKKVPETEEPVSETKTETTLLPVEPQAEVVREEGSIFISTIPPRALIYMDGKMLGRSNDQDLIITSGTHDMKFLLNTLSCEKKMTFKPGKNPSILIRLPCRK